MILQLDQVSKTYQGGSGQVAALLDASLDVEDGQFVAIRGPSGCGKSTLLLLAGGLLAPTGGTVKIAGQDPYTLRAEARAALRAKQVGFVFQQFHLVPYLNVLENVLAPSLACQIPSPRERAERLIDELGLTSRRFHVPGELSTGERQRTALARALLAEPKLLLADEPTGNLDRTNADIVLGYLTEFANAGGAVLLVTHDSYAAEFATRTLRLEAGRVVAGGSSPATADQAAAET